MILCSLLFRLHFCYFFFFFNDTATTEIYTLSLHDALPIYTVADGRKVCPICQQDSFAEFKSGLEVARRSEEHTSELQSQSNLVCRLLLEKKKKTKNDDMRYKYNTWKRAI